MAPKMVLEDGTYYTPEDLAAKKKRDAERKRRERAEAGVADLSPASQIGDEPVSEFVSRIVSEAIAPLAERVKELESTVGELNIALAAAPQGATAPDGDAEAVPAGGVDESAAGGDSESAAVVESESAPAAPSKPSSRGGRTGKAPAAVKDGE